MFVEADADVTLDQFGDELGPPFPCFDHVLFDVPGSTRVLACLLIHIQVTRLKCRRFIFASRMNHAMCDAAGLMQFLTALGEIARGASAPSISLVWRREPLNARNPPRVTPAEIRALRQLVPPQLGKFSSFDLLTACLWRSCIRSLHLDPEEEVRYVV
ncbi:hypothetical protein ACET3Z_030456 [Daucus carota]